MGVRVRLGFVDLAPGDARGMASAGRSTSGRQICTKCGKAGNVQRSSSSNRLQSKSSLMPSGWPSSWPFRGGSQLTISAWCPFGSSIGRSTSHRKTDENLLLSMVERKKSCCLTEFQSDTGISFDSLNRDPLLLPCSGPECDTACTRETRRAPRRRCDSPDRRVTIPLLFPTHPARLQLHRQAWKSSSWRGFPVPRTATLRSRNSARSAVHGQIQTLSPETGHRGEHP